jgi:hypothetical protein
MIDRKLSNQHDVTSGITARLQLGSREFAAARCDTSVDDQNHL